MNALYSVLQSTWAILLHTPWWVFLLLAYCIFIGIKASKGGVVPYIKMLIVPILFTYMSLDTLFSAFTLSAFVVSVYVMSLVVGLLGGCLQGYMQKIQVDRSKLLIKMSGTWSTLIIILVIFFSKFYFGYEMSADPALLHNTVFEFAMLAVSGVTTGLFVGRAGYYTQRMFWGPSVSLSEK